jgi:hypothetical protein
MGKFAKPKFNDARRHRVQAGLSLAKFAKAKTTGFDKRREIERKRALQAKKVHLAWSAIAYFRLEVQFFSLQWPVKSTTY